MGILKSLYIIIGRVFGVGLSGKVKSMGVGFGRYFLFVGWGIR